MAYAGETPIAYMPISTDATIAPAVGEARLDIRSESGIGEAMFWVMDPESAGDIILRFHLRGLEELKIAFGGQMVRAGVLSHGDRTVHQALVDEGGETPIEPDSPYWAEITPGEAADGMPEHFDVGLPPAVFDGNGMFRVSWIDFYR